MDLFQGLSLVGGLCLFLFGMTVMGQALERRAGNQLKSVLARMTTGRVAGFLTGLGVTSVIQSSSATTVMVVGFVNAGLMTLRQAINVIMGANVGTTVTAWILSLGGIQSDNFWVSLCKPSAFTPILALIGVVFLLFSKKSEKKDTGTILLGFATLIFGMDAMTAAVSGLANVPAFQQLFLLFQNPLLGMAVGALLTGIIQSSSASVGILQALSATGQVTYGAAVPIIMGQNIGTCVTALISSIGANKNAKRAALVHLSFNVIGTAALLSVYALVRAIWAPAILQESIGFMGIAVVHSLFNVLCVVLMMPMSGLLEKLVCLLIPDDGVPEEKRRLDERLLATPALALEQCRISADEMAQRAVRAAENALSAITSLTPAREKAIRDDETACDRYEDAIGSYLIRVGAQTLEEADSEQATALLKIIGDFERISDHAVNILESSQELRRRQITLTQAALDDLDTMTAALREILSLSYEAFQKGDEKLAEQVEPLEQVIDSLKEQMRTRHILRLQGGNCTPEADFVWSDLLTNLERLSDHCSNIAGCVIDAAHHTLHIHSTLREARQESETFRRLYASYAEKYALA